MINTLLNRVHILEDINNIIKKEFDFDEEIEFADELYDILESLEILDLFMICEEKYDYRIDDSEYEDVNTFGDLVDIIIKYGRD